MRRFLTVFAVAAALSAPSVADAAPPSEAERCATAFERAQVEQKAGRLKSASELMKVCVAASCPALIRSDCAAGAAELDALIPDLIVRATDGAGADVASAEMSLDDGPFVSVDGRSLRVDPGSHRLRVRAAGYREAEHMVVAHERARGRVVTVPLASLATRAPAPVPLIVQAPVPPSSAPSTGTVVGAAALAGLGVAGVGTFAALGLGAAADYRDLERRCGGACPKDETDAVRNRMQIADVALVVGAVAVVAAGVVYFFGPRRAVAAEAPRSASR